MKSRFWTREVAKRLLFSLFLLTAFFAVVGPLLKFPSGVTSAVLIVIQAATAAIALYMPLSRKDEARRKMRTAMSQYAILDSLMEGKDDKSKFLNRVINRMRELAPDACYCPEEIADYLESTDVGERFAALASVQWQWQKNTKANDVTQIMRLKEENPKEFPEPPEYSSNEYFPQLLKVLCRSWDKFQNYHATAAMWNMVDSLGQEAKQVLFERVLDQNPPGYKCDPWEAFKEDLRDKRKSLT
jgi:hypothetical protein